MPRSLTSCVLTLALTASATLVVTALATPADAATGDVMSLEWHTQTSSGGQVSTSADFIPYSATSTTAPGGARFAIPGATKAVTLAPPTGSTFQAGQTYSAAPKATATVAQLSPSTSTFSTSLCPLSTAATFVGSVTVLSAQYDDTGTLTDLAADYQGACTLTSGTKATEYVAGSVRHDDGAAWLVQKPTYQTDIVPVGQQRSRPVTITATATGGRTITLGAASLTGARAADYQVAGNHCAGTTLGDGSGCTVDVVFKPATLSNGPMKRVAMLTLAATGHVSDAIRVRLDSSARDLPGPAANLTTYPTANGVGVSWDNGYPSAQQYALERRYSGTEPWAPLTTIAYGGSYNYVDHDTQPGQAVSYRVTGSGYGWDGPAVTTSTVRPASVPTPGPDSLVAYGSTLATGGTATVVDGVDGATVTASGSGAPTVTATAGPTGTGYSPARVSFQVPMVPGPGSYASPAGVGATFGDSSYNCTYAESVLEVRSVAYDETPTPVVLDGSWVGRCTTGTVVRIEIRLGVDTRHVLLTADPTTVGRLTTWGGRTASATVTVTSAGPDDATLGAATTTGTAAGDWKVTDNGCAGLTLHAGDTCPVTVTFSSTADNARPAVLRVAGSDASGPIAPVMVTLDGWGATPPTAPSGSARGTIGAALGWWSPPGDGGRPVLSYDVQRRPTGGATWTALTTVAAGPNPSFVDRTIGTNAYDYRVRAVNEVGPGPWVQIGLTGLTAGSRAVVVSGSTSATGPRGLFQVDGDQGWAPYIPLTSDPQHDYRTPAVSPGGTRLAVSVSSGDGSNGEYDLWSGTLANPAARQLTSMPGAESDPAFSPDAAQIAFTHVAPDGSRSVWVVPALGGAARLVRAAAADPAWMPDGSHLVMEDRSASDQPLLSVDVTTGASAPLANTEAGSQPAVSRAGAVAYVDAAGRVLEIPAGQAQPQVKATPPYNGVLGRPAYDDGGKVFYESTRTDSNGAQVTAGSLNVLLARVGQPAPVLADLTPPWLDLPGYADTVRGAQSFSVVPHDLETPESVLRPRCRLDGAAWQPCAGSQSFTGLAEGPHLLDVRVADEAGHTASMHLPFTSDTAPPTLTMSGPGRWLNVLAGRPTFSWDGHDSGSGPSFYETRVRTATPTTDYTTYRVPKGYTSTDSYQWLAPRVAVGQEYCVRVRVQDASGLWSAYLTRCAVRPVDDASLAASSGWSRIKVSGLYQGTETTTSRTGATLRTASTVTTRRIGVVASTCPTCGSVGVYVGQRYVGKVSLVSSLRKDLQLLRLPLLPQTVSGRVVLKTLSSRPVRIDGLSLARS
ncbi:MAG: choice-of-anchor D domain-containing protein [Nocardioidaceae bacterium]